jgi:hypothetical protein
MAKVSKHDFDELSNAFSHYERILLSSVLLSEVIYEKKPIKSLNENYSYYNHYIEEAEVKKTEKKWGGHSTKYLICENNKTLIVAFRGTADIDDFLTDIVVQPFPYLLSKKQPENDNTNLLKRFANLALPSPLKKNADNAVDDNIPVVHSGFFLRSEEISIDYFLNKILKHDYKVVFTGHSLGAAVAALVAIKLIFHEDVCENSKIRKNIFFFGFGCPAIGNSKFCSDIDEICKSNFHFYVNEDDYVPTKTIYRHFGKIIKLKKSFLVNSDNFGHGIIDYRENVIDFIKSALDYSDVKGKKERIVDEC